VAGRWARRGGLVLGGALVVGLALIASGGSGDSPAASDPGPAPNIEHPTSNLEHRTESDTAQELLVTPVAFAETTEESSDAAKSVTFDDIKFEMKKDEKFKQKMLTEKITGLFDKNIRIRGYILPSFKQTGLTQFVLVRDNMECCFGPGAALYDCIIVQMVEGHTANYSVRPVTVEGKFSFQKLEDPIDGALRAIYHLDGVSVK
jgi:hypothetical protein